MLKYKDQVELVDWHIKSEHSAEMAEPSEVVRCFVLLNLPYIPTGSYRCHFKE